MKNEQNGLLLEDCFFDKFRSPIPPHLTPAEKEQWEKENKWEKEEFQRRLAHGFYPDQN